MKFGQVENPEDVNFSLPPDHPKTKEVLKRGAKSHLNVYVGCAKWNKTDLQGFYPKGTKNELEYYSRQFNCVELNATFYKFPTKEGVLKLKNNTTENFKFFPKLTNSISHYKRLKDVGEKVERFLDGIVHLEEKLEMVFLQLHDNFTPKYYDRVEKFVMEFPKGIPLAIEVRNEEWFMNKEVADNTFQLFEENKVTNIIVDSAGRRDMVHMRLTTPAAFIRYVGSNHPTDYLRLDIWLQRIKKWRKLGLENLYFFVHQNIEIESPLLASYLINGLNSEFGLDLKVPDKI
jgi:uncharacterized protein YecE (DUF72 family)